MLSAAEKFRYASRAAGAVARVFIRLGVMPILAWTPSRSCLALPVASAGFTAAILCMFSTLFPFALLATLGELHLAGQAGNPSKLLKILAISPLRDS